MIITALTKIHLELEFTGYDYIKEIIEKYSKSKNVDLQQRSLEYLRMYDNKLIKSKDFISAGTNKDLVIDSKLSFLNSYVRKKISEGAKTYDRSVIHNKQSDKKVSELKIDAYKQEDFA